MGETFERLSGCRLITDPTLIDLNGERTLLMHGDTLCTDDVEYQQFRAHVRNPETQRQFLAMGIEQRIAMARQFRDASRERNSQKAEAIMDVNQDAVANVMRRHGVRQLIHGHTHRPAVHDFELDGHAARRIVLGDWYEQGSVLVCDAAGCDLEVWAGPEKLFDAAHGLFLGHFQLGFQLGFQRWFRIQLQGGITFRLRRGFHYVLRHVIHRLGG